ncbi:MAG TPA: NAD(P)/FAD-dependent oxidoreductase [Gemmatimonadales bacterium]
MSRDRFDAIVIGAGANGLAAAAALARAGHSTLILERASAVGGKARCLEFAPGFRAAPLSDTAGWLPPSVAAGLGMALPALDQSSLSVTVDGGGFLTLDPDPGRAAGTIRSYAPADAERWPRFTALLDDLAGFLARLYQRATPDVDAATIGEMATVASLAWHFRRMGRRGMIELMRTIPMSVQELLDDWFTHDALKAVVASGGVHGIRQGPRAGGTGFVLLHHRVGAAAGSPRGRGYWRAGPDAAVLAFAETARRHGATIRTDAEVTHIVVTDAGVSGVVLRSGEQIDAATVLATPDPGHVLLDLVDPVRLDPEFRHAVKQIKYRGSTAYVLYALDARPDVPGLSLDGAALTGTVSLTANMVLLERAYDAAKHGTMPAHPHVEFSLPSVRWPHLAPTGKHILLAEARYVRYAPEDDAARETLTDAITRAVAAVAPRFEDMILHRATLTPRDLAEQFGLSEGAATHGELTLDQILFMRPVPGWAHYRMPVSGLYLCGAGTHPGPGVLGGAGWLAARSVCTRRKPAG